MATKATRQSFGEAIAKIGEKNLQVVVMDADLGKSTMTGEFARKFPERYFEMGIAEKNLIGTAVGLSLAGKIPFAASFACFVAGQYETVRMSVSYSLSNVKLIGTHSGIGIGEDGNSQMGLEDIAVLRSLPNMVILQPADDLETQQAVAWAATYCGPVYMRLTRHKVQDVHDNNYKFEFGKGDILKKSATRPTGIPFGHNAPHRDSLRSQSALTIFATGGVVYNALKAVEELEKEGMNLILVNVHTIKPIDDHLILSLAKECNKFLTIEDHNVIGGLGSAVSEVVTDAGLNVKVVRHGVQKFGESGQPEELYDKFGFSIPKIKQLIQEKIKT